MAFITLLFIDHHHPRLITLRYLLFLEEFEDFLSEVTVLPGKLAIMGDFYFNLDEPHKSEVNTILSSFGLERHIKTAMDTYRRSDLVITRAEENLVRFCDVGIRFGSNHYANVCSSAGETATC